MLKLCYSAASPFVRKVMVCASELGLEDGIERLESQAHPVERDERIGAFNPLAKVPAAFSEEGLALYDSRVICEYLDSRSQEAVLFPAPGAARWKALTLQALGDGIMDAAILARYERAVRPKEFQWEPWREGQIVKIRKGLEAIEKTCAGGLTGFDIGAVTLACALGYLDFRFGGEIDWREGNRAAAEWFAGVSERPSMAATRPPQA